DMVVLEEGDHIPADGRLIISKNFRTIESPLTGESIPVSKAVDRLPEDTQVADQKNMVWRGTFAVGGYANMIVTGTGSNTVIGNISDSLEEIHEKKSNFARKTDTLAMQMSL